MTEDSGIDLTFGECERMDKLKDTKTETLAYDTDAMDNLEDWLLHAFTCLQTAGKHNHYII